MEITLPQFVQDLKAGRYHALFEAHQISTLLELPLKALPFDKYFMGLCSCKNCGEKIVCFWAGHLKSVILECPICFQEELTPNGASGS